MVFLSIKFIFVSYENTNQTPAVLNCAIVVVVVVEIYSEYQMLLTKQYYVRDKARH